MNRGEFGLRVQRGALHRDYLGPGGHAVFFGLKFSFLFSISQFRNPTDCILGQFSELSFLLLKNIR